MKKYFLSFVACLLSLSFILSPVSTIFAQTTMSADVANQEVRQTINILQQGGATEEELAMFKTNVAYENSIDLAASTGQCVSAVISYVLSSMVKQAMGWVFSQITTMISGTVSKAADVARVAFVPVNPLGMNTPIQLGQSDQVAQKWQEDLFKAFLNCILSELVRAIAQATVNWINNGFKNPDGSSGPAFLSNPEKFFKQIANIELGNALDAMQLCEPFRIQIQLGLIASYRNLYNPVQPMCTLDSIKDRFENFGKDDYWGDFAQLGLGYNRNTFLGAYFSAGSLAQGQISTKVGTENWKLSTNSGFLGWTECVGSDGKSVAYSNTKTVSAAGQTAVDNSAGVVRDEDGNIIDSSHSRYYELQEAQRSTQYQASTGAEVGTQSVKVPDYCPDGTQEKIRTPGTMIRDQLSGVATGYLDQTIATVGESVDQIIGALINQLTKMAVGKLYEMFE